MASKIAKAKKSELIEKLGLTCMSRFRRPTFETLLRVLKSVITFLTFLEKNFFVYTEILPNKMSVNVFLHKNG